MPAVQLLLPEDITVFTLDLSGSGKSEGEYISLGWFERDDVHTVVEYLRNTDSAATIGLWGRSMGAVTALLHSDRDPSIAGIVADSPFSDLRKLAGQLAKKYTKMPGFVVSMGTKIIAKSVKNHANFDLDKVKPIDHVDRAFVPILFGHAKDDDFIEPSHCEELHEKYSGDKNYISFDGDHNSMRPQFFEDSIVIFFINCLQVHYLVPQGPRNYEKAGEEIPDFNAQNGFEYDDDFQMQLSGFSNEVTEEDMIKMAIEESMKTQNPSSDNKEDEIPGG
jgi:pimeloyl-ACP methyl ester carboxylesterase